MKSFNEGKFIISWKQNIYVRNIIYYVNWYIVPLFKENNL